MNKVQFEEKTEYYRGCEIRGSYLKGWTITINGEVHEIVVDEFEEVMEYIDSVLDN